MRQGKGKNIIIKFVNIRISQKKVRNVLTCKIHQKSSGKIAYPSSLAERDATNLGRDSSSAPWTTLTDWPALQNLKHNGLKGQEWKEKIHNPT